MHGETGWNAAGRDGRDAADVFACIRTEVLEVRLGPGLAAALLGTGFGSPEAEATLDVVHDVRRALARETGIVFGGSHWTDRDLRAHDYEIFVRRRRWGFGALAPENVLASGGPDLLARIDGEPTVDPVYGGPAKLIAAEDVPIARALGAVVSDARDLVCAHLARVVRERLAIVFGLQEFTTMLRWVKRVAPAVFALFGDEAGRVPRMTAYAAIRDVLREAIPPRNPLLALEAVADAYRHGLNPATVLRDRLAPAFLARPRTTALGLIAIDTPTVERIASGVPWNTATEAMLRRAFTACEAPAAAGLVCPPHARSTIAAWARESLLTVPVFGTDEIPAHVPVRPFDPDAGLDGIRAASELHRFVSPNPLRPPPAPLEPGEAALSKAAFEAVDIEAVAAALERELAERFLGSRGGPEARNVADARARRRPETCFADVEIEVVTIALGSHLAEVFLGTRAAADAAIVRANEMRREIARETGVVVPSIRFRTDLETDADGYHIFIGGVRAANGRLESGKSLVIAFGPTLAELSGAETEEPVYGLRAKWVDAEVAAHARTIGASVFDPLSVLVSHMGKAARERAADYFGIEAFMAMIGHVRKTSPALIAAIDAPPVGFPLAHDAYRELLRERVWPDPVVAFECFLEDARPGMTATDLAERARKRTVPARLSDRRSEFGPVLAVVVTDASSSAVREEAAVERLAAALRAYESTLHASGRAARAFDGGVVLCPPEMRRVVRDVASIAGVFVSVYATDELPDGLVFETVETISL